MIEGTLNVAMKGGKATLLQKRVLHVSGAALCFVGILFLETSTAFPEGKLQLMNERSVLELGVCQGKAIPGR